MNQSVCKFLKDYGTDEYSINRLLVSSFVIQHKITNIQNLLIKNLLINEDELEYGILIQFLELIKESNKHYYFEELVEFFEFVISPSDKLVNGAIYTPKDIREFIIEEVFSTVSKNSAKKITVADIACGCGGFLIDSALEIKKLTNKSFKSIFRDNIFGIDIQKYSIERTKILLSLLALKYGEDTKEFEFNLFVGDSLEYKWQDENKKIRENKGFDIIVGNPPYVCSRNMNNETKELMKNWSTCKTGHPDLYIPFFQIGYELLKPKGILGYITVNTFIKSLNGRAIRKYFSDNQVDLKIIDFEHEQIFNSRMTYTSICFLKNIKSETVKYTPLKRLGLKNNIIYEKYKYIDLSISKGWYLKNKNIVNKIEKVGTPFGEIYNTKSGIATLKNNVFIFKPIKDTKKYYYIDKNTKIEKSICKDIVNSNLLVKTDKINNIIEKIIFPYEYNEENQIYVISEDKFINDYPFAYHYLLSNKDALVNRDKGKGKDYKYWYAFGRNQSLERYKYKLLFPQMAREGFKSCFVENEDIYFYNGMAAMAETKEELKILEQVFKTDIFWLYVKSISKPYASNYFSLGKNYIKNFGISDLTEEKKKYILNEKEIDKLNKFFNNIYLNH
ncbi:hypothetical protein GCM10012288_19910 [Malaciobacter pacificus]|uniref:site-specific DNA-methyltransferase (adenine-specific) n=1 Tax=Malaciobacter pacificus TaxID=1080223 RepID=A0A5C2H3U7_9BACT|nr:N-6 DNA methylase [Malaciobacter pacificus]QEP33601.1 type II DNA methyltransferase [Malaciobacter pacificus]GGD45609.1 hypothetical protein GCM10012288_19910 [Malaciobacter pacificus]